MAHSTSPETPFISTNWARFQTDSRLARPYCISAQSIFGRSGSGPVGLPSIRPVPSKWRNSSVWRQLFRSITNGTFGVISKKTLPATTAPLPKLDCPRNSSGCLKALAFQFESEGVGSFAFLSCHTRQSCPILKWEIFQLCSFFRDEL